jgi:transposase-like protein
LTIKSCRCTLGAEYPADTGHLKDIYAVDVSAELAAEALDGFAAVWDTKYPMIAKSWRNRRNEVIPFFKFSPEIRKAVAPYMATRPTP